MTDTDQADEATPVRIPNVRPGAVSGIDNKPLVPSSDDAGTDVPGELVESDTAGTGEATNAETGETTQPGEPLPTIEDDGTGTPLDPPQPGADADGFGGDAPAPADSPEGGIPSVESTSEVGTPSLGTEQGDDSAPGEEDAPTS